MKTLVICCDGTWNKPDQKVDGVVSPTNVVKLKNCLAAVDRAGNPVSVYYHPGVGTDGNWFDQFWGGALGKGLDQHIMGAYSWLCENWQPDSRVFLFGFSRGAYTVRSLVGFVQRCGLLSLDNLTDDEKWAKIEDLFHRGYRQNPAGLRVEGPFPHIVGATPPLDQVTFDFMGVWDTVGALGIPDDMGFLNLLDNPAHYRFHDTSLHPSVKIARQALAMDEIRSSFAPTRWTIVPDGCDCKQVWFPGCHSDVGGGFLDAGLSDGALQWMISEAKKAGLAFIPSMTRQIRPNFRGTVHDPVVDHWAIFKTQPRNVSALFPRNGAFHPSVYRRAKAPPPAQAPYWPVTRLPATQPVYAKERWNATGIFLEYGKSYCFTAKGQWVDFDLKYGPDGKKDGGLQLGDVAHAIADQWGILEKQFQEIFKNQHADFWLTKRIEKLKWFELVGAVANANEPQNDGTPDGMEIFDIGLGQKFAPKKSGYLYVFANDAWHFYGNNKGSVQLTVSLMEDRSNSP